MKIVLFIIMFFPALFSFSQNNPVVYKRFRNNEDRWIADTLTLSSDSTFFSFASCECGKEYFAKGKWHVKKDKLYLAGFDSTKCFPKFKIRDIEGTPGDSVSIVAFDYFHNPIKNMLLGVFGKDSMNRVPTYMFIGDRLTLSKKDYIGFYLIYASMEIGPRRFG